MKGEERPHVVARLNGKVGDKRYRELGLPIARRLLHAPGGSYDYTAPPTMPEIGICLDFLHHLSIDRNGAVSVCVRYDPEGEGVIGNINDRSLDDIWNIGRRMNWMTLHVSGRRAEVPFCSRCEFWGVPTGGNYVEEA